MKKLFGLILTIMVMVFGFVSKVSANSDHRVLLLGDSLTALAEWPNYVLYNHTVVAEGGVNTNWVLAKLRELIISGEIVKYDTAVVWIGVNDPYQAVTGIPEIYGILHSYDIKIIGVTQYFPSCRLSEARKEKIIEFNEVVRDRADVVVDLAIDPLFVDGGGYVTEEASVDCVHLDSAVMTEAVSGAINRAVDELYVVPIQVPTSTVTPVITVFPTPTATMKVAPVSKPVEKGVEIALMVLVLGLGIGFAVVVQKNNILR